MNILNDYEFDAENDIDITESKRNSILEELKKKTLLRYGAIITESDIEEVTGEKRSKVGNEQWQFIMLHVREIIKSQGFYVTSRGLDNNLYILLQHEMPLYNEKKNKSTFRNLKQRTRALHMIDHRLLSLEHQKKLEFEIFRNASFEIEMANSLKKRCRY